MDPAQTLLAGAAALGVPLTAEGAARLLALTAELARWNRTYNLTAITDPQAMLTHHLLDSLAVHPELTGTRIADVGTGAGFPGLPLALLSPDRQFTLIDSSGKKLRFVAHAAHLLGLGNVATLNARVEALHPEVPFDTVLARAFAPLARLLPAVAGLCGPDTTVLAMKGRRPDEEIAALPAPWRVRAERALRVPGLDEARCVLTLSR
ncbi:MAG TPA: 16S rRNA (guanine(527)-N(7))-methyltransferase RsmG [Steroidobacteraceae bacterium]|nr:16S rRNA (guanine(527)-N(7))-methyltransferase RsmG [Steroidobacteraceae bacterium]